jgi:hypothetical protein
MSLRRATVAIESMCICAKDNQREKERTSDMTRGHPSKAQKTLSIYMLAPLRLAGQPQKFYNFLKINATLHKAHHARKKAYPGLFR